MRITLPPVAMILLTAGVSAFAVQSEPPGSNSTHRTQVFRSGKGEPRVRDAATARTASARSAAPAEGTGRSRPYQAAKPGEGAPKN